MTRRGKRRDKKKKDDSKSTNGSCANNSCAPAPVYAQDTTVEKPSTDPEDVEREFTDLIAKLSSVKVIHEDEEDVSRGVTFAFVLENQFLQYKEKVEEYTEANVQLQQQLLVQRRELNDLIDNIADVETEMIAIDKEIREKSEELFQIEKDILALNGGKLHENLIGILKARGMSDAEARNYLNI